jgi:hypothetical protein
MKSISFPLYWPNKASGKIYLQGRPCVGYERLDTKIIDPDDHSWPTKAADEAPMSAATDE